MLRSRILLALLIVVGLSVAASACGGDEGSAPAAAPPAEPAPAEPPPAEPPPAEAPPAEPPPAETTEPAPAETPFGVGLTLTDEVVAEGEILNITEPWLVWNSETCSFQEAEEHPDTYVAATRKIEGDWQIGYMHYGDSDPFGIANSESVKEIAALAGFTLNVYNLEYPSKTVPIDDAKASVLQGDKGVLQGNLEPTILPAFFKILEGEGCIPSVAVYGGVGDPRPSIGAIFKDSGRLQGEWLAQEATARGFPPDGTAFVQCTDPTLAPFIADMFPASIEALKTGGFAIPDDNIFQLNCPGQSSTTAVPAVKDWFTAHPDFDYVLINGPDDLRITGVIAALKAVGRNTDKTITIGNGLDQVGRDQVRSGDESASVAFFPENYGLFLIPVLQDLMAGNPVPQFVQHLQLVVTKDTLDQFYPE